jgi:hypothetical protein
MESQVEQSVRELISYGMSSNTFITDSVLQVSFVDSRSSTEEVNMLVTSSSKVRTKSIASTIAMFGAGLAAVAVVGLAAFVKRRSNNGKKSKSKILENEEKMPADVENAIKQEDSVCDSTFDIDQQNSFYGHSISSASTQMVSNRRPKPVANPLYLENTAIVEEALSEDESEDALPSFHPEHCLCLD